MLDDGIGRILTAAERLPAVAVEFDDARRRAEVRVNARVVAHIDLDHDRVLVTAPADVIPALGRVFPSSRRAAAGIVFDLRDGQTCSEALDAIRRRVNVERFRPQSRLASP